MAANMELSLEALGVNLPYSIEAEQAVLGAALIDGDLIPKIVESLRPEMFYARQNGEIFAEIMRLFTASAPVDFVTLLAAVQDAGIFPGEDEAKVYLTQLAETVPALSHTDTYVKIIAEKYRVRQLIQAAKTILERTGEETDADLLLESAEQQIYEIRSGRDSTALTPINSVILDTYAHLQAAQQRGDAAATAAMRKALYSVLRQEAKDIHDKYIEVPYTTGFGILFLPFEGLYAEVVSSGVTETLQRDYQITVAGPSTMAALLNALQMGFRTLAIQKRSGEVWTILGAVKTEFEKFGAGLQQMQRHLNQTGSDLEELIGPRSRAITRKLEAVQQLDPESAAGLLGLQEDPS